jgi:uncharacterized protein YecT (DUF1311 family)
MKKIAESSILIFLALGACSAQESPEYVKCVSTADAQKAMTACASDELSRANAELNALYQKLLASARAEAGAVEKIRAAETVWRAYPEAYIAAMYPAGNKQATYGSLYPMQVDLLRAEFTRQQISALRELLTHYSAHGGK